MMTEPARYAVFGHPIEHSKSPIIHHLFARQTGQNILYNAEDVPADIFNGKADVFFSNGGQGLNCTVPLKELAWEFAQQMTQRARISKAVNTLAVQDNGSILGDNTDGIGLISDLTRNHEINLSGIKILLLGAGGASRGILGPLLDQAPATLVIANRTVDKALDLARELNSSGMVKGSSFENLAGQQFDLIINATSASLSGQLPALPVNVLTDGGNCYDLAYSTEPTAFVRWGQEQGAAKSLDGVGMLVEQAAEAFYIWRHVRPDTQPVIDKLLAGRDW